MRQNTISVTFCSSLYYYIQCYFYLGIPLFRVNSPSPDRPAVTTYCVRTGCFDRYTQWHCDVTQHVLDAPEGGYSAKIIFVRNEYNVRVH